MEQTREPSNFCKLNPLKESCDLSNALKLLNFIIDSSKSSGHLEICFLDRTASPKWKYNSSYFKNFAWNFNLTNERI